MENFALVYARKSDGTRNRRIEVSEIRYGVAIVAIKVEYNLIEDNFHVNESVASDKIVLKTLYKDKKDQIYYKGPGKYSNYKTIETNSGKTYLDSDQLKELDDYIKRYKEYLEK